MRRALSDFMSTPEDLKTLRRRIDEIDDSLLDRINERISLAVAIGANKADRGEAVYRPEREAQILERLIEANPGPLSKASVRAIFREIISAARSAEAPIRVAALGPRGTFSEQAAVKVFGQQAIVCEASSIKEVFRLTEVGETQFGVVPIENSTEGGINATLDLMMDSSLVICNEVELRVSHCLLGHPDARAPRQIAAHEQALAQCRVWLGENYPEIPQVASSSTAEAARSAAADPGILAVASEAAAGVYGLDIKAREIEDLRGNTTRFLVLSKDRVGPSGKDKTSLVVANSDRAGALLRLLQPLADAGISMTRIESRPMRAELWRYVFFIDIQGHIEDPLIEKTLRLIEAESAMFRILGSYPRSS